MDNRPDYIDSTLMIWAEKAGHYPELHPTRQARAERQCVTSGLAIGFEPAAPLMARSAVNGWTTASSLKPSARRGKSQPSGYGPTTISAPTWASAGSHPLETTEDGCLKSAPAPVETGRITGPAGTFKACLSPGTRTRHIACCGRTTDASPAGLALSGSRSLLNRRCQHRYRQGFPQSLVSTLLSSMASFCSRSSLPFLPSGAVSPGGRACRSRSMQFGAGSGCESPALISRGRPSTECA